MRRLVHRITSILSWAAFLVLGGFGIYFTFANYPAFGIAVALSLIVLLGHSERSRRQRRREAEGARRRDRREPTTP
jgi:heme exporter protein D